MFVTSLTRCNPRRLSYTRGGNTCSGRAPRFGVTVGVEMVCVAKPAKSQLHTMSIPSRVPTATNEVVGAGSTQMLSIELETGIECSRLSAAARPPLPSANITICARATEAVPVLDPTVPGPAVHPIRAISRLRADDLLSAEDMSIACAFAGLEAADGDAANRQAADASPVSGAFATSSIPTPAVDELGTTRKRVASRFAHTSTKF